MGNPERPSWTTKHGWARGEDAAREVERQNYESDLAVSQESIHLSLLEHSEGIAEQFPLTEAGFLDLRKWQFSTQKGSLLELVAAESGDIKVETEKPIYKPDDVRIAAANFQKKYPHVLCTFDQRANEFSYTIRLDPQGVVKKGRNPWAPKE